MSHIFCLYHLIIFNDMFTFFEKRSQDMFFLFQKNSFTPLDVHVYPRKAGSSAYDL